MKKISVVSRKGIPMGSVKRILGRFGFVYDSKHPEAVLTVGGDGTLLMAERMYPGILKIPLRHRSSCRKCAGLDIEHALEAVSRGECRKESYQKLCVAGKKGFSGLNDIVVRNKRQWAALRFSLEVDGKKIGEFIGDGIVAATPFGSTGYFHSATGRSFTSGFGLGFINIIGKSGYVGFSKKVEIKVLREEAVVSADNNPDYLVLHPGENIRIVPGGATEVCELHQ